MNAVPLRLGLLAMLCASLSFAAVAPKSEDDLKKGADEIVSGRIIGVKKKIELKSLGGNKVYHLQLKVDHVQKGSRIKVGDVITLRAWHVSFRYFPTAELQGHEGIPSKGDEITAYLTHLKGTSFQPLYPNGMKKK